jgi:1,4-dihydroxy-2-naphthoyl-CoA hydrolase
MLDVGDLHSGETTTDHRSWTREHEANDDGPMDLADMLATMPFAVASGVVLDAASAEEVRGHLPWAPERCTIAGAMHGGAVMTLADSMGAVCAFLNLPLGASTSTVSSSTNFFRAVREGDLRATTRPLHTGRTTIVVQTELRDTAGKLVALVTQTQAVLNP